MSGARRPSGSVSTSSSPIRISRPERHGGVEHRPGRGARRRDAAARVGIAAASSADVDLVRDRDRVVGVLRARLDEDAVDRRVMARAARALAPHRHQAALGEQLGVARGPDAGLDPDPALGQLRRRARASRPRRGSARRGPAARSSPRSPAPGRRRRRSVIHSPVDSEISTRGTAARSARTAAAMCAGSSVSWPSSSRGCTCSETTPAATHALASAASSSGVRGTPVSRSPFRQAWRTMPPGRTPRPAAPRRSGTSSACRPRGSARAWRRSCRRARPPCRARTAAR